MPSARSRFTMPPIAVFSVSLPASIRTTDPQRTPVGVTTSMAGFFLPGPYHVIPTAVTSRVVQVSASASPQERARAAMCVSMWSALAGEPDP